MRPMRADDPGAIGDLGEASLSVRDLRAAQRTSGYPSPAEDATEGRLDVRTLLVKRPAATFFARVESDAMRGEGIAAGDVLVIDRALPAAPGALVVAAAGGDLVVRRYSPRADGVVYLLSADPKAAPLRLAEGTAIWGVVTFAIHPAHPATRTGPPICQPPR